MKTVRIRAFGSPDVLSFEDAPRPVPKPCEILVSVRAAGLNPVDLETRKGEGAAAMLGRPFPVILGWDFAGTVVGVGKGVTRFVEGDAAYGMVRIPDEGTYSEYVTLPAEHAARKPETLTFDEAAAVPLSALTAWQALFATAELRPGQRVLIHAAEGGVGYLAVQLAKARGAEVTATTSARDFELICALGADLVLDRERTLFEDRVNDMDVVLDTVGDDAYERSLAVLKHGGILVSAQTARTFPNRRNAASAHVGFASNRAANSSTI
jgi:NADPH:quinone reductase-like Zn-dependent oxidoreductase